MKLQDAVAQIINAMDAVGFDYMLVGSFSSMYYSFPRSTTPEDVILQKLIWYQPKDQEDVLGVIAINHEKLDRDYLRHWADQLDLSEVLAKAWASAIELSE